MACHLLPQLPRFVAIVAKFLMCKGKVNNFILFFILFHFSIFLNDNEGRKRKMIKSKMFTDIRVR